MFVSSIRSTQKRFLKRNMHHWVENRIQFERYRLVSSVAHVFQLHIYIELMERNRVCLLHIWFDGWQSYPISITGWLIRLKMWKRSKFHDIILLLSISNCNCNSIFYLVDIRTKNFEKAIAISSSEIQIPFIWYYRVLAFPEYRQKKWPNKRAEIINMIS